MKLAVALAEVAAAADHRELPGQAELVNSRRAAIAVTSPICTPTRQSERTRLASDLIW